jgi:hypothetical protein
MVVSAAQNRRVSTINNALFFWFHFCIDRMSVDELENDYEKDLGERPPKKKKTDHEAQPPGVSLHSHVHKTIMWKGIWHPSSGR